MAKKTIRPVAYEKRAGTFQIVTDINGIAKALLHHYDPCTDHLQGGGSGHT